MSNANAQNKKENSLNKEKPLKTRWIYIGIAFIILMSISNIPAPGTLPPEGMKLFAIVLTVVFLWVTEALPLPISALLLPMLIYVMGIAPFAAVWKDTTGSPVFAFLLGIMTISVAFRKVGLSKIIANYFLLLTSTNARLALLSIMSLSFFVSMWITDMAAVAIVLPVAIGIIGAVGAVPMKSNFAKCIMLGISWGSIFGGMATPAGVGSNIITLQLLNDIAGISISFTEWIKLALPISIVELIAGWLILLFVFKPEVNQLSIDKEGIKKEIGEMGKLNRTQLWTLFVFALVIVLFITSSRTDLDIRFISLMIVPLLMLPGVNVFKDFGELQRSINWGAIFLAVAGIALGNQASEVGLADWIAETVFTPVGSLPTFMQLGAIALITDFIGLVLSSMTITASVSVPIVISFAQSIGAPVWAYAAVACLASSTVVVLVTQTPALILGYAEGYYSIKDCAKAGIILTFVSALIIASLVLILGLPAGTPIM